MLACSAVDFLQKKIDTISQIYHLLFVGNHSISSGVEKIKDKVADDGIRKEILRFIGESKTGVIKRNAKFSVDED